MPRRPFELALTALIAAVALPGAAAAQSFVPQPQHYLLSTDAFDGRALWVQPAGLMKRREASLAAMVTARRFNDTLSLAQYGLTLASSGFAAGWQHDRLPDGRHSDAYVLGYAIGGPRLSLGGDYRRHRGSNTRDAAWDVGGRYVLTRLLEVSAVWRDLGSPVILGDTVFTTLVPGVALQLFGARVQLGADWEIVTRGWGTSAIRAGATFALPARLLLNARAEFNGDFKTRAVAVGLTWRGSGARVTGFGSHAHGGGATDVGLWSALVTDPSRPRRRFGR